jgi:hypothetical protein
VHILFIVLLMRMQGCFAQEQIQNVNIKTVWSVSYSWCSLLAVHAVHTWGGLGRAWQGSSCTVIAFDWKTDYREEL